MDPFPTREAQRLLKEWEVDSLPIDPKQIAARADIPCQPMPSEKGGVSGMLVKTGNDRFGIMYATHIPVEGFHNFSISHELGHYYLPEHPENVFKDGLVHESSSGFTSDDTYEKQADQFACGLLMPSYLFDPLLDKAGTGMEAVLELAERCGTSRAATAIRYAQKNSEPTAIVMSIDSVIEYCFMSDELKEFPGLSWIKKGSVVPKNTRTLSLTKEQVQSGHRDEGESDLITWFRSDIDCEIYEEVIGLGAYGKSLTVLSCGDLPDPEAMDEEHDLEESWTPRFKR
ncbi:MAG: hypothetical protein DHS20C09_08690 [marine bacterium B5-7]|nr:MAG: hypothetical protein DHS20C09_08690 [marine bacterium B5-7]